MMNLALCMLPALSGLAAPEADPGHIQTQTTTPMRLNALGMTGQLIKEVPGDGVLMLKAARFMQEAEGRIYEHWEVQDTRGKLHAFQIGYDKGITEIAQARMSAVELPDLSPETRAKGLFPAFCSRSLNMVQVAAHNQIRIQHQKAFPGCPLEIVCIHTEEPKPEGYSETWTASIGQGKTVDYAVQVGAIRTQGPVLSFGPGLFPPMEPGRASVKIALKAASPEASAVAP